MEADVLAWAGSGAMALTGRAGSAPLGPPARLVPGLTSVAQAIADDTAALGRPVELDPLALLGERAALRGLTRQGSVSCGGMTRLLSAADGWYAVSLPRPDDTALVQAWLELPAEPSDPWAAVGQHGSTWDTGPLVERGRLLGLPVAALPTSAERTRVGAAQRHYGDAPPVIALDDLVVVDLSALWAGPLAASVLASAGARVLKVESTRRPDALRHGDPGLFDLLNAGKLNVALDLPMPAAIAALRRLIARADVVVEASRPRALEQWGILADEELSRAGGPQVWLSITGYGRTPPGRDWVALGDDAAVAGGLVATDADGPCFCADAVADPATGLVAAAVVLKALRGGGRWLVDASMAGVAADLAGPTRPVEPDVPVAPPRARQVRGTAAALGADTAVALSLMD